MLINKQWITEEIKEEIKKKTKTRCIMRNAGLEETQAGIKIARRNINNSDMQMIPPLWQKVKQN